MAYVNPVEPARTMSENTNYIENVLVGDEPRSEYLLFLMPIDDYLEYDDADLYCYESYNPGYQEP